MPILNEVLTEYQQHFNEEFRLYRSPGRINLIGEHTDYNNGYVLPAAIDKAVYIAIGKSSHTSGKWISVDFKEVIDTDLQHIKPVMQHWANYILGIVDQFQKRGHSIPAVNLVVAADLPVGAGLSSSAALEAAVAFALNDLFELGYNRLDLARICQQSENEFIGVRCGIMDMFASLHGKKDHIIRLDCRSLAFEYVPFKLTDYEIMLLDTNVKHSLASSEYNLRRQQCEEGVAILKKFDNNIQSLRDVSSDFIKEHQEDLPPLVYQRCLYVVEENERLLNACTALLHEDFVSFGQMMFGSHNGLQHQYEVSCAELDFLAAAAKENKEVLGARMMGGGFGGCTINLVKKSAAKAWYEQLAPLYQQKFGKPLTMHEVHIGEGTERLDV